MIRKALIPAMALLALAALARADTWFTNGVPTLSEIAGQTVTGVHVVGQTDATAPAVIGTTSVASPIGNLTTVNSTTVNAATVNGTTVNSTTVNSATVNGTTVNGTTVASTTVTSAQVQVDTGTKTATASAGAATLNKNSGSITTESLTTAAAGGTYTLTLSNSTVAAADQVLASVSSGTNTQGIPVLMGTNAGVGQIVFKVANVDVNNALNGTLVITFLRLKN